MRAFRTDAPSNLMFTEDGKASGDLVEDATRDDRDDSEDRVEAARLKMNKRHASTYLGR